MYLGIQHQRSAEPSIGATARRQKAVLARAKRTMTTTAGWSWRRSVFVSVLRRIQR
jgi:hypothetical protein